MRRAIAVTLLPLVLAGTAGAQPADTTKISTEPLFTPTDALIAAGFALGTIALYPADRSFAQRLQRQEVQAIEFAQQQARNLNLIGHPGAYIIGVTMYTTGRIIGNREVADLGLHGTEALLVGQSLTVLLKGIFGRARPYASGPDLNPRDFRFGSGFRNPHRRSFPSGHTTAGFAAAAAVTAETSRWWPQSVWYIAPVMYGGATLIGLARMYDNRHWASDVITGAAIGTFAGLKVVRYHHSHPDNRIDKWLLGATVVPDGAGGATLAIWLRPR